ncbi:MAG: DNA translocase FtsK 4TM domain-containing protein, partial [Anaerolineae bacterium]
MTRRKNAPTRTGGTKRRTSNRAASATRSVVTTQRRREVAGAFLLVLAVVTLISFVSHGGALTQRWLGALQWLLGWGAAIVPVAVGALGIWLVMHAADEDSLRWERPLGGLILFVSVMGLLHLVAWLLASEEQTLRGIADDSSGGGWLGYAVANALEINLGTAPSVVTLTVLGMLGVSLALARPLQETALLTAQGLRRAAAAAWASRPDLARRRSRRAALAARVSDAGRQFDLAAGGLAASADEHHDGSGEGSEGPGASTGPSGAGADAHGTATSGDMGSSAAASRLGDSVAGQLPQRWRIPQVQDVLDVVAEAQTTSDEAEAMGRVIEDTLAEFGIPATVVKINRGPSITQFGLEPGYVERAGVRSKVKVSRIKSLQNDLALALAASPIRIQAPVPGRPYVGVEVPNSAMSLVSLRSVVESEQFAKTASKGVLPIALGRDTSGRAVAADLAGMPHLLVAGATGSGKSVAINSIICALLLTHTPETLRLILVDPKRVEMAQYRGLPHLATPVVVEIESVIGVLKWTVREMDRRYKAFAETGVRNIDGYNKHAATKGLPALPYLVLVIDELADLMMVAPEDAERLIT